MPDTTFLLRGIVLGFSVAAPVGPIGLLCIRRSLCQGASYGFVSGLGAATADTLYGCVAAFGLALVTTFLLTQTFWLRLVGGAFLLYLGWRTFRSAPAREAAMAEGKSLLGAYVSTLALTVTNPATILSFAALFAGTGFAAGHQAPGAAIALVLGVFVGSACWWLLLSSGVSLLRDRVTPGILAWVNRGSGLMLLAFGVAALVSLWR